MNRSRVNLVECLVSGAVRVADFRSSVLSYWGGSDASASGELVAFLMKGCGGAKYRKFSVVVYMLFANFDWMR